MFNFRSWLSLREGLGSPAPAPAERNVSGVVSTPHILIKHFGDSSWLYSPEFRKISDEDLLGLWDLCDHNWLWDRHEHPEKLKDSVDGEDYRNWMYVVGEMKRRGILPEKWRAYFG